MELLQDKVYTVRDTTMKCIRDATIHLGGSWAEKNMIPKILPLATVTNYLQRETFLFLIQVGICLLLRFLELDKLGRKTLFASPCATHSTFFLMRRENGAKNLH